MAVKKTTKSKKRGSVQKNGEAFKKTLPLSAKGILN